MLGLRGMVPLKYASTVYVPGGRGTCPSAALPWKSAITEVANVCVLLWTMKITDLPPNGRPSSSGKSSKGESRTTATNGVDWFVKILAEAGVTVRDVVSFSTVKALVSFEPKYAAS